MSLSKNNGLLFSPLYWPAWLGLGILWLITRLPYRLQIKCGAGLGRLLYLFPGQLKKITQINIGLCYPKLTPEEQRRMVKNSFASLGIGLVEAAMAWWLPDKKLQILYKVHGYEHFEKAHAKGKGIILLSPHFTCLEIIGRLMGMRYTFGVMYRPHKKALIAFIHERFRKKHYVSYIPSHGVHQLLTALKNNMPIWYAYDIDGGRKNSVFAPFFGLQTASLTAVTRIVNLTGAAVVPIGYYRRDDNTGYDIHLYPALESFPSNDLVEDATRLNAILEKIIREHPEQYVWQYKRFKTRPKGDKRFY